MNEWVRYLEAWTENTPVGEQQELAHELLSDSVRTNELTHYQAHLIMGRFLDERGYT